MCRIGLVGGLSSWDYDRVHAGSTALDRGLQALGPSLDDLVLRFARERRLPLAPYRPDDLPAYIDGVLIEDDPIRERAMRQRFDEYAAGGVGEHLAYVTVGIPDSFGRLRADYLVTRRVSRADLEELAHQLAALITARDELRRALR